MIYYQNSYNAWVQSKAMSNANFTVQKKKKENTNCQKSKAHKNSWEKKNSTTNLKHKINMIAIHTSWSFCRAAAEILNWIFPLIHSDIGFEDVLNSASLYCSEVLPTWLWKRDTTILYMYIYKIKQGNSNEFVDSMSKITLENCV